MSETTQLFPANAQWSNPNGTLTPLALRSLASLAALLGGTRGNLPASLLIALNDGSAGSPALSFAEQTDLGLYRAGNNALGIAAAGQPVAIFSPDGLHLQNLRENAFVYNDASGNLETTAAALDGQILIGDTNSFPKLGTIEGVPNQVQVSVGPGTIIIGLLQDLGPGSDVTFASLTLTSLTENAFLYSGVGGLLTTTAAPTDGQLLIGDTGGPPVAATLTGTANQVIVTNAAGSITLSTPQDIATTSNPTFNNLILNGTLSVFGNAGFNANLSVGGNTLLVGPVSLTNTDSNTFLYAGAATVLSSTAPPVNGQLLIGSTGAAPALGALTGTANQVIVTNGAGTITLSLPQSIATSSSPTFAGLTLSAFSNAFIFAGAAGAINGLSLALNGALLIGAASGGAGATTITGTANQVIVTNGAASITLSLPQSIGSGSSPTFTGLTLSGLTANAFLYSGTAGALTSTAAPTNGQLLIGSTGAAPARAALTGTANQITVTNGAGTITLATPQDIATSSSPTFASLTLTANLQFTGTSNRITADFSNATINSRTAFQTSTANSNTGLIFLPNGTATTSNLTAVNNSTPTNAAFGQLACTVTDARLTSGIFGTGTQLPLTFFIGGSEAARFDTSLQLGIGTTTPSSQLHVSGTTAIIRFDRYSTGAGNGAAFIGRHANGTPASPTQTLSGDDIAAFVARGYGATGFVGGGAAVKGLAAQDFTDTVGGMHLVFSSNPNGGLTLTEGMRLTQAQNLLIGTTTDSDARSTITRNTSPLQAPPSDTVLHYANANAASTRTVSDSYANTSNFTFRRANTTAAAPSALASNDEIARFAWTGYHSGSAYSAAQGALIGRADEAWTSTARGTSLALNVTVNGTTTLIEAMRVHNSGHILIGSTTETAGTEALQITGSLSISSATMIRTYTAFTNGAGAGAGTLTNAPAAGNPTKWIPINDNGTVRYIPAW